MSKHTVKPKSDKFMGLPLGDADESDSDTDAPSSSGSDQEDVKVPKKKPALSVEDLERAGYKSGPSVLLVKPPAEQEPQNWNWSSGRAAKQQEGDDDGEDRAATREAVTKAVEESALHSIKAMQHAARLREEARQERLEARQQQAERSGPKDKALSYNQKEKRKRDAGQSSRGKNYVEESKRQAREFGIYSGFD
ncbi:hypothetical protein PLESTB_000394200 [Pleodorina starrii]|uniref:Uncharacterized protein n=1 Tax=Pleodorina starrii TaxID=330485 RepID=A0A9W6BEI0_9CHLO|nr:hypothetical protein PLESTM_000866200 [Pleodorina starrii]GLC50568.1 hypothetical protein PLESTB_000394200 [Pleodorina starrii]GLC73195.1 hypothetical protein PLESTF_001345800 [Pleodorina starrii]